MIIKLFRAAFTCPFFILTILGGVSAFALIFALIAQYGFNLQPCILCLYQRIPYAVVIALAILGIAATKAMGPKFGAFNIALCGIAFLVNSGIAFYNVGVEQGWYASGCSTPDFSSMTPDEIMASIRSAPTVPCDQIAWSLLGISMAGYNVILCLGLGVYAFIASFTVMRHQSRSSLSQ